MWGIGPRCVLRIPLQTSGVACILEVELGPCHAPPEISGQIVRINMNGVAIGWTRLDALAMIRCEIAPSVTDGDGLQDIEFEFPGFYQPEMLGRSTDSRPLSAWFSFARLYTTDMFRPGPHFPTSHPDIPVISLMPPLAGAPVADMKTVTYTFGRGATAFRYMRDGWNLGEANFTWTEGNVSRLELPAPGGSGCYALRLDAWPMTVPGEVPRQDVTILLDGYVIGQQRLDGRSFWLVPLPRELTEGRTVLPLAFALPDARRPSDFGDSPDSRQLGIALSSIGVIPLPDHLRAAGSLRAEQEASPPPIAVSREFLAVGKATLPTAIEATLKIGPAALARGFESIGTNCEFGIVQRQLGVEVLNLFRFCNVPLPELMLALTDDLKLLADPAAVTVELNDAERREFVVALPAYNLRWHTFTYEDQGNQETLARTHGIKLGYLRRKFYEGLSAGRKIYVVKQRPPIAVAQALALLMELNRHGHATLLWVEQALDATRSGEVELLAPGLMRGYVERFAPDNDVESADTADWLRVIANAFLLHQGPNAVFREAEHAA